MNRHVSFAMLIALAALFLNACGSTPQAPVVAAPAATAVQATATVQSAPTTAPAAQPTAAPTQVPPSVATAVVQPTAAPAAATSGFQGPPVRVVIKDLQLDDSEVVALGLDKDQVPMVDDHHVTWYELSALPGEGDNVVLEAHVYRFVKAPQIPAPFAHIKELKPGAKLTLFDAAGNSRNYKLDHHISVKPDEVEYMLPQGKEMVTAISCYGDDILGDNGLVADKTERLISIFLPVE